MKILCFRDFAIVVIRFEIEKFDRNNIRYYSGTPFKVEQFFLLHHIQVYFIHSHDIDE